MKLTPRLDSLENRMVIEDGQTWKQLLKSPLAWECVGWLLEGSAELYAITVVLAINGEKEQVKGIFRDMHPRRRPWNPPPTDRQLEWAYHYIRASYVWISQEKIFTDEIARWELEEGLDNEQNTD